MKKVLITLVTVILIIVALSIIIPKINKENEIDFPTERTTLRIGSLKGPTSIGLLKMMEDNENKTSINNYDFMITGTADEITAKLIKGELDIAAIPCNLASILSNKAELSMLAINNFNVLYIIETGNKINSISDLKGKTIYTTGKGTTPEYILNYLLEVAGIKDEVIIEYKSESSEVAALLNQGKAEIAMLPQPYVTTIKSQNPNLRIALDVGKEWEDLQQDKISIVTAVIVARKDFIDNNKIAVDEFLKEYKESIEYVNNNIEEASNLSEKFDIIPLKVAKEAIPLCNIKYVDGQDMRDMVEGYLQILFDKNPESIGGKLPDANFYYKK